MGADVFGRLRWLEETAKWTLVQRSQWRLQKLNAILEYCWTHVPFYQRYWRDHGLLGFKPLRSFEDLRDYPILRKETYKTNASEMQSDQLAHIPHKRNSTGGTTGQPLQYCQDLELWSVSQAFNLMGWGWAGYRFGDPIGILGGYSLVPQKMRFRDKIRYAVERKLALSGVHMEERLAREYHRRLQDFGAQILYGYPSILSLFASCLRQNALILPQVKAVITTAEMLLPQYRRNIEDALPCKVWDQYGCNDGGVMSHECRMHTGHHYNDLQVVVELFDRSPDGSGALLLTNLWNRSMPFIRYENGDIVSFAQAPCPCGAPYPLIRSVEGRTADILSFSNGRSLSGPALTLIFRNMDIDGWQVVLRGPDTLEVRVLAHKGWKEEQTAYVRQVFATHAGKEVVVDVIRVETLETSPGGKLKPVWIKHAASHQAFG